MTARPALPNLDTLPPEALKALIHAQQQTLAVQAEEIRAQREQLHSQDEQLAGRQAEIERYFTSSFPGGRGRPAL